MKSNLNENEKNELRNLLEQHLTLGDKEKVAKKFNRHQSAVSRTIKEMDLTSPYMEALVERAERNKKKKLDQEQRTINKIKNLKA